MDPEDASEPGTWTYTEGSRIAAATPCLKREYRFANTPTVNAPNVYAIGALPLNFIVA
jgi:hypothetical protein